ncbi:lysine histidine transporter-like 6 protein [Tanacetum coccineum]
MYEKVNQGLDPSPLHINLSHTSSLIACGVTIDYLEAYVKALEIVRILNALGPISFAYAGHAVALEIQATIPSRPGKPSRVAMWKSAMGAYFVNAMCYLLHSYHWILGVWTRCY